MYVVGDVHAAHAAPSSAHWNEAASPVVPWKLKVADVWSVTSPGHASICVSGGPLEIEPLSAHESDVCAWS